MRTRRMLIPLLCALAAVGTHAAAAPLEVALDYRAPPACPSRAEFAAQVARGLRSPASITWVDAGTHPSVRAVIAANDASTVYSAELTLIDAEGHSAERAVSGAQCADVTAAAALMASLFLAPSVERPAPPPHSESVGAVVTSLEVGGGIRNAVTPSIAPVGLIGVAFARESTALLAPLLDVSLGYSHAQLTTSEGNLAGDSVLATAQLCLLRVGGKYIAARACIAAEGGLQLAHWAQATETTRAGGWLAGGLGLQVGGPLSRWLAWNLTGTGTIASLRSRFYDTSGTLYASPLFSFGLSAGLRFSIW